MCLAERAAAEQRGLFGFDEGWDEGGGDGAKAGVVGEREGIGSLENILVMSRIIP
jgi:hypothetical protein